MTERTGRSWRTIIVLAVVVIAGIAFALSWRARSHASAKADTLIVGDQRGGAEALLRAAGELDHVPYTIKFALFPAASPLLEALDANAIDVGGIGGSPFAFAYASGAKIKAVHAYRSDASATTGRASAIIVPDKSPLRTLADLKGKKVATIKGSAGQDLVLRLLEHAGLPPNYVQWVYLANGEAKAALANGSIDAWSTWGSYVGISVIEDHDRVLADATGLPSQVGFFAASDTAIEHKRALLDDFLKRLARARLWARDHKPAYATVLAKETGIPLKVALFTVESAGTHPIKIDDEVVREQQAIFQRYRAAGVIPFVPDVKGGYDASFNDAVP